MIAKRSSTFNHAFARMLHLRLDSPPSPGGSQILFTLNPQLSTSSRDSASLRWAPLQTCQWKSCRRGMASSGSWTQCLKKVGEILTYVGTTLRCQARSVAKEHCWLVLRYQPQAAYCSLESLRLSGVIRSVDTLHHSSYEECWPSSMSWLL